MEGSLKNGYLYNDKELWDDADLNWYDYGFRNYDPQIGRFTQLDPLTWDYPELTNYQYASNEPIANVDLDGLDLKESINAFSYEYKASSNLLWAPLNKVATKTVEKSSAKLGESIIKQAFKSTFSKAVGFSIKIIGPLGLVMMGDLDRPSPHLEFPDSHYQKQQESVAEYFKYPSSQRPNANRKDNPNNHIVYELYGITHSGEKEVLKYGISDYTRYKEKRPRSQTSLNYINRVLPPDKVGAYVEIKYEVRHFNNRFLALSEEKRMVTKYAIENMGKTPLIQKRPAPMTFEEYITGTEY